MAGLFAALSLRQRGMEVVVFERAATELSGRGAGIATHAQILDVIESLGLDTRELGVSIRLRRVFGPDGRLVAETVRPQLMTSWDRLFTLLRAALPAECYRRGQEFVRAEQNNSAVTAHFADGSRASGDLLIGADGLRSSVRTSLISQQPLLYAGYVAWRAFAAEHAFAKELHNDLFDALGFSLPAGEQMLGYPVAGPGNDLRPGHRRYNIVWYRPADEPTLARLLTDCARASPRHFHPAAAHPGSDHCGAARCRRDPGAAVPHRAGLVRSPVPAADLRFRSLAHACWSRGADRRCRVRGAPACRRRGCQGGPGCGGARAGAGHGSAH